MTQALMERKMQTTRIQVDGKPAIVGVLREMKTTPLIEAPFAVKAFNEEHGTDLKLIGPRTADHLLVNTDRWKDVKDAFPAPVSAVIAFERLGERLGKEVVFAPEGEPRMVLSTGTYSGQRGVAVVAMDITAEDIQRDGNDVLIMVPGERLVVVPGFPSQDGYYLPHGRTTVPFGDALEPPSNATRYLPRRKDEAYVGFLVRSCKYNSRYGGYYGMEEIHAEYGPSEEFGVAVEVPERDLGKIEKLSLSEPAPIGKLAVVKVRGVTFQEFETLLKDAETNLLELYDKVMLDHVPHLDVIKRFFQALKRRD